jgi:hypothetical protein
MPPRISPLATSNNLRSIRRHASATADLSDCGWRGSGAKIDPDDAVLNEMHHSGDRGFKFRQLCNAEVAQKYRVLQALAVILHKAAHSA